MKYEFILASGKKTIEDSSSILLSPISKTISKLYHFNECYHHDGSRYNILLINREPYIGIEL